MGSGELRGKVSDVYCGNPLIAFGVDTVGFRAKNSRNGCIGYRIEFDDALELYAESQVECVKRRESVCVCV